MIFDNTIVFQYINCDESLDAAYERSPPDERDRWRSQTHSNVGGLTRDWEIPRSGPSELIQTLTYQYDWRAANKDTIRVLLLDEFVYRDSTPPV
ncbi:MAG: hypothetical protein CMJ80_12390 [Planctomycetaceae bacterium]|nr:hypothetical protein [Planctomycetaceae bacterium]